MTQENIKALPAIGIIEATKKGFKGIFNFSGRTRRSEYWQYTIVVLLLMGICIWVVPLLESDKPMKENSLGEILLFCSEFFVIGIIPLLLLIGVQIRRLHDVGKNAILPILAWGAWLMIIISLLVELGLIYTNTNDPSEWVTTLGAISFCIFTITTIVILCYTIKDSEKFTNTYGKSPKYIEE